MAFKLGNIDFKGLKLESVYNAYFGMSPREQTFALAGAVMAVVLIIVLPVYVAGSRIGRLERELEDGRKQLRDVVRSIDGFNAKRSELAGLQQALAGGFEASIASTVEIIADRNGMKEQIDSLRAKSVPPSDLYEESAVDVRLRRVRLEPLINLLHDIQNEPDKVLSVKGLTIKPRFDSKSEMDVSFSVSTYRLIEGVTEGL